MPTPHRASAHEGVVPWIAERGRSLSSSSSTSSKSPSPIDLYKGTSEGVLVQRAVALDGIPCVVRTTVDREAFGAALHVGLTEAMREQPGHLPVVHISAHGNASGIQLTSGEVVTWQQLHDLLDPISKTLNGFLLLCMSACERILGVCKWRCASIAMGILTSLLLPITVDLLGVILRSRTRLLSQTCSGHSNPRFSGGYEVSLWQRLLDMRNRRAVEKRFR